MALVLHNTIMLIITLTSSTLNQHRYQLGQWALSREGSALQGKVPELAALVGLLGGDEDTISGVSLFRWKDLVLAQLLYVNM